MQRLEVSGALRPLVVVRSQRVKRDEVTGEWKKILNEELNDMYSSPNIVRGIK